MDHLHGLRVNRCLFRFPPVALVILGSAVGVDFRVGTFTWGSYHQLSASIMYTGAILSVVILGCAAWDGFKDGALTWTSHSPLSVSYFFYGAML